MTLAHLTENGFYVRSEETDSFLGEGTFTELPPFNPATEVPRFLGDRWEIVPLAVRDAFVPPPPPPAPIPTEVSAVQAKTALFAAGLFEDVERAIGASAYPLIRIWWASAQVWKKSNPYVHAMAAELDLDDDAVDRLFVAAAQVPT